MPIRDHYPIVRIRLDYCNAVLYGITRKNVMQLQRVQNSPVRIVCVVPFRSSSAPLFPSLHWLPVRHGITHKVAALTFKALLHHQPTYIYQMLNTTVQLAGWDRQALVYW